MKTSVSNYRGFYIQYNAGKTPGLITGATGYYSAIKSGKHDVIIIRALDRVSIERKVDAFVELITLI